MLILVYRVFYGAFPGYFYLFVGCFTIFLIVVTTSFSRHLGRELNKA
jgi:hypothetical protein